MRLCCVDVIMGNEVGLGMIQTNAVKATANSIILQNIILRKGHGCRFGA